MQSIKRIVIIGSGTAGINLALNLRQNGFAGNVTVFGTEHHDPYQRPPLSKNWLLSDNDPSPIPLRPASALEENEIVLRLGQEVALIDRKRAVIVTETGEEIPYDRLVFATGAAPRRLDVPGADLKGVFYLRSLDDAAALRRAMRDNLSAGAVVVGAGVIGLEVASAFTTLNRPVTVVEAGGRVLARVASVSVAAQVTQRLEKAGIHFLFEKAVARIEGESGSVKALELADGTRLPAQLVIIGIGAVPQESLALKAGLTCDDGILVDEEMRTSDEHIYAIGDCARGPNEFARGKVRIETIHNAMHQAKLAAASLCDKPAPAPAVPRFWSDLAGMKLQGLGIRSDSEVIEEQHGESEDAGEYHHFENGQLVATETINLPMRQNEFASLIVSRARTDTE